MRWLGSPVSPRNPPEATALTDQVAVCQLGELAIATKVSEFASATAPRAHTSAGPSDGSQSRDAWKAACSLGTCREDHSAIVIAAGADRHESAGFIPSKEYDLAAATKANAADPVLPEGQHPVQASAVQDLGCGAIGILEIGLKGQVDRLWVNVQNEVRCH